MVGTKAGKPEPLKPEYQGKVVSILDGGTIEVLLNQRPSRIRLSGIDCPEKGQAFGKKAKQVMAETPHPVECVKTVCLGEYQRAA